MQRATGIVVPYHGWSRHAVGDDIDKRYHWFEPGAFAGTLEEVRHGRLNVPLLLNHNSEGSVVATTGGGNLILSDRPDGLHATVFGDAAMRVARGLEMLWEMVELSAGLVCSKVRSVPRGFGNGWIVSEARLTELSLVPWSSMGGTRLRLIG